MDMWKRLTWPLRKTWAGIVWVLTAAGNRWETGQPWRAKKFKRLATRLRLAARRSSERWVNGRPWRRRRWKHLKTRVRLAYREWKAKRSVSGSEAVIMPLVLLGVVLLLMWAGRKTVHGLAESHVPWLLIGEIAGGIALLVLVLWLLPKVGRMLPRRRPAHADTGAGAPPHAPAHRPAAGGDAHADHGPARFGAFGVVATVLAFGVVIGYLMWLDRHMTREPTPIPTPVLASTDVAPQPVVFTDPCMQPGIPRMQSHSVTGDWQRLGGPKKGYRLCINDQQEHRDLTIACRNDDGTDDAGWLTDCAGDERWVGFRSKSGDPVSVWSFYLNDGTNAWASPDDAAQVIVTDEPPPPAVTARADTSSAAPRTGDGNGEPF